MKKNLFVALLIVAGLVLFASCGSAPKSQAEAQPVSVTAQSPTAPARSINYSITDWQGASLGRQIPEWVGDATDRNKTALVSKVAELKNKEVYIYTDESGDLDMIRANAQINAFTQISTQIKAAISSEAGNKLAGNKDDVDSKRQYVDTTAGLVSQNVISGFALDRDFWQKRKYPDGKATVEYLAIYAIGAEDLRTQIDIALGKIEAKTAAEREAKEAIRSAVKDAKSLLQ